LLICAIVSTAATSLALASPGMASPRPSLAVVGLPTGVVAGQHLPYTEVGGQVELSAVYAGRLPAGGKLGLLVKDPGHAFKLSRTPIRLSAGHARLHVTFNEVGGPVSYELALLLRGAVTPKSRPVTVYYAQLPGGVFAETQGSYASFTSRTNASESCAAPTAASHLCNADGSSGEVQRVGGFSATSPVPPGWKLTLSFQGQTLCTSESIEARCESEVTFPTVAAATTVELTATLTSPHGQVLTATRLITVYP
jgi:hypothetical protein